MFRLANFDDTNAKEDGLYRYLSLAISNTIVDCLNDYLNSANTYRIFYDTFFSGEFFSGVSKYIKPQAPCDNSAEADAQVGFEFTCSKMERMKEKMQDPDELYTFDVFEERILFIICEVNAQVSKTKEGKKALEPLKAKVETAKKELREKYGLSAKNANDYSKKMYLVSSMPLKDDEDDNIIFWDDDYAFYWKDGFISGIEYLKGVTGQNAGYGYKYTCDIFSDIGIKPPLMLLGTEEANRIAVEVGNERLREKMNDIFGDILSAKSLDEVKEKFKDKDEDLPFN